MLKTFRDQIRVARHLGLYMNAEYTQRMIDQIDAYDLWYSHDDESESLRQQFKNSRPKNVSGQFDQNWLREYREARKARFDPVGTQKAFLLNSIVLGVPGISVLIFSLLSVVLPLPGEYSVSFGEFLFGGLLSGAYCMAAGLFFVERDEYLKDRAGQLRKHAPLILRSKVEDPRYIAFPEPSDEFLQDSWKRIPR